MPSTASAGVDMTATMGRTQASSPAVNTSESPKNSVTVLPVTAAAWRRSPAPTARPMQTVVPMASPTIMTVSICMTWLPMDTAVVLATPSNWPTMNRSAIPYSVCKK